ncbi:Fanconi anemia core complex-associated protein 100 isoform X2 [Stegostoma tigrinum]|uniref:Fanconi anemia core complex-associated protein 100 isoform X2 n=1 Tax=Stegostoma tigrinum TaxID=3053191 RepID=UPI00287029F3|nr:Fanconi anemia core complex-associated protein 100 isoform X2 [Stegostoma tigrinum]
MAACRTKAVRYLDPVKLGSGQARGGVRLLGSPGRLYVWSRSEFVSVYQRDSGMLQSVFKLPSSVWHVEVDSRHEHLFVLCAGSGIYSISLNHSLVEETGAGESFPAASQSECNRGNSMPRVCAVRAERCIIRDPAITSFILSDDIVVTVVKEDQKWRVTFLRLPLPGCELQPCRKIEDVDFPFHSNFPTCEKSPETISPPVLCCIYPRTVKDSEKQLRGDAHMSLEPSLFSLLFSVDANMLNSPIILCGLPDGQLCFVPIKYVNSEAKCHASRVKVLHHLEQPVVFIGVVSIKEDGNDDSEHQPSVDKPLIPDGVVVIGKGGKIVIIKASLQMEIWFPNFIEYHLRGPITSACCYASTLYYSTCWDFFSIEFVQRKKSFGVTGRTADQRNSQSDGTLPSILTPISLNICGIVAVSTPSLTANGDISFVALTEKGKVMMCTLPYSSNAAQSMNFKAATAGQRIKDLLAGIGSVNDRIKSLKRVMQQKDKALKGLNQDFNICCGLLSNQEDQEKGMVPSEQPISCYITAKWNRLLLQDSLVVCCILENLSDWPLEHRWSLCVRVIIQTSALTKSSDSTAFTYNFPISELTPGKKMEVAVPLNSANDDFMAFPVSVHCFLHYNLNSILTGNANERPFPHSSMIAAGCSDNNGICLPVNTHVIDLLDCLHIRGGGAAETVPALNINHKSGTSDPLAIFLQSLMCFEADNFKGNETFKGSFNVPGSESTFSASIKLSSELAKVVLKDLGKGDAAVNGSDILQWLFSGNPEVVPVGTQPLPMVHCTAPDGSSVQILSKQVAVADFSVDGSLSVMEIVMECSSLTMLCFLHQAITRRVQMLLEQSSPSSDSLPGFRVQSLRQLVHNAEFLSLLCGWKYAVYSS